MISVTSNTISFDFRLARGNIETCTSFPGLTVQFSVDSGTTWKPVPKYFQHPNTPVHLRTLYVYIFNIYTGV